MSFIYRCEKIPAFPQPLSINHIYDKNVYIVLSVALVICYTNPFVVSSWGYLNLVTPIWAISLWPHEAAATVQSTLAPALWNIVVTTDETIHVRCLGGCLTYVFIINRWPLKNGKKQTPLEDQADTLESIGNITKRHVFQLWVIHPPVILNSWDLIQKSSLVTSTREEWTARLNCRYDPRLGSHLERSGTHRLVDIKGLQLTKTPRKHILTFKQVEQFVSILLAKWPSPLGDNLRVACPLPWCGFLSADRQHGWLLDCGL